MSNYQYVAELGRTDGADENQPIFEANQIAAKARLEAIQPDSVELSYERTWACAIVAFKVDFSVNGEALRTELDAILAELDNYPILDEYLWSELQFKFDHPEADNLCYADDSDCGCGLDSAY